MKIFESGDIIIFDNIIYIVRQTKKHKDIFKAKYLFASFNLDKPNRICCDNNWVFFKTTYIDKLYDNLYLKSK